MFTRRNTQALDGAWLFATDPGEVGERDDWQIAPPEQTRAVTVPHIWQSEPDLVEYQGVAWYFLAFTASLPVRDGMRAQLIFDAVDYHARVWLNGVELGENSGGYTPFSFEATESLKAGENLLAVRVFDPANNTEIPTGKQERYWYTRVSGIWQSVRLEERAPAFIENAHVMPSPERGGFELRLVPGGELAKRFTVDYALTNHAAADGPVLGRGSIDYDVDVGSVFIEVPDMVCWEPENPFLYELALTCGDDVFTTVFGMRSITVEGNSYVLNGNRRFNMRGALDQAFYPDTIYRAPSEEYIKNEITLAKQMGFNLLRKHLKPELPQYLYWADRMGMLIWAEYPCYAKWTQPARERFSAELLRMVDRDFNHPSIIIWSIYNEEWGLEWRLRDDVEKQRHVIDMFDTIKKFDPTRLICDNSGWTHVKTDINDFHRYFALPEQAETWRRDLSERVGSSGDINFVPPYRNDGQPIVDSEFGNWSIPNLDELARRYGGKEPWWFVNTGDAGYREDFKLPDAARRRFEPFGLARIFGSFAELTRHSEQRMFRSVKAYISEMRMTLKNIGYVVTEFTDIEWETNGWLDFHRQFKSGFDRAADFNGPLTVHLDLPVRSYRCGDTVRFDLVVCNDDRKDIAGKIAWRLDGTDIGGTAEVGSTRASGLRLGGFAFTVPDLPESLDTRITVTFAGADFSVQNYEEITLVPPRPASGTVAVHHLPATLLAALEANGWETLPFAELRSGVPILAGRLDAELDKALRGGARAIFLAEDGEAILERGRYTFRHLPLGESWDRASSFMYVDTDAFPGVPLKKEMGWEVDGLTPDCLIPLVDYKVTGGVNPMNFYADPNLAASSEILAGYYQGWIGQCGATMLQSRHGKGEVLASTWKLCANYGRHPVGTLLLDEMIRRMGR